MSAFSKFLSVCLTVINFLCGVFGTPKYPTDAIDMSKFKSEPAFAEEFNGDSLDKSVWRLHGGVAHVRRGSYWDIDMAQVYGGALHIKTEYLPDGLNGNGAGWYTAGIDTKGKKEYSYGYYECRCILPAGEGHWSAFWMLADSMNEVTGNGINGAEIDVMESAFWSSKHRNSTAHTIHYDGYGEEHKSMGAGQWRISGDPYSEYHTYGVEWNEEGYTFYIDGKKTGFTDGGGASRVSEYMILSVEVGGENCIPADSWAGKSIETNKGGKDFKSDFVVDYVKYYEYK